MLQDVSEAVTPGFPEPHTARSEPKDLSLGAVMAGGRAGRLDRELQRFFASTGKQDLGTNLGFAVRKLPSLTIPSVLSLVCRYLGLHVAEHIVKLPKLLHAQMQMCNTSNDGEAVEKHH